MGAYVGSVMAINGVSTAKNFKIWRTSSAKETPYAASNTQQGVGRKCGNEDWRGYYWAYGHTPDFFPGDDFSFDALTHGGKGLTGTAIIQRCVILWNIKQGDYIAHRVDFARNGALDETAGTATDATQPGLDVFCAQGTKFVWGSTELLEIETMMLDIRCANRPRVTSSTSGGVLRARGNLDLSFEVQSIEHDPAVYPALNTLQTLKFYVDASDSWDINWGYITGSPVDYGADHETLEYVGGKLTGDFTGHSGTATGSIVTPAGVTKWPFS